MRMLVLDPSIAGASGDMVLSALIDLTGLREVAFEVARAIEARLGCRVEVSVDEATRAGVRATRVEVEAEGRVDRVVEAGLSLCRALGMTSRAEGLVERVLRDLVEAEGRVHGGGHELHELASPDTLIDVVGSIAVMERSGLLEAKVYATPPALGGGTVSLGHAQCRGPAPATLELLRAHRASYLQVGVDEELTTPTGAALILNLAEEVVDLYPPMRVARVGYGAGSRELIRVPNVLRAVEGESMGRLGEDRVVVVETNLDDVTGELVGYLIERLVKAGALDVSVLQGVGRKGRPCLVVKALARPGDHLRVVEELMRESGTLGVRVREESRVVAERRVEEVDVELQGARFKVRVKVSWGPRGELLSVKPEHDDVRRVAEELGAPLRKVYEEALRRAYEELSLRGAP